jgi:hypothetical protein
MIYSRYSRGKHEKMGREKGYSTYLLAILRSSCPPPPPTPPTPPKVPAATTAAKLIEDSSMAGL